MNRCSHLRQNNEYLSYVLTDPSTKFLALYKLDCLCETVPSLKNRLMIENKCIGVSKLRRCQRFHRESLLNARRRPTRQLPFQRTSAGTYPRLSRYRRSDSSSPCQCARSRNRFQIRWYRLFLHRRDSGKSKSKVRQARRGNHRTCQSKGP